MTPNGSLIAYTTPANIRELRDQVALVSMSWKETLETRTSEQATSGDSQSVLETLTLEFDSRNLLVRYLQPRLLLVLEGGVPPGRKRPLKTTAEGSGDARYPPDDPADRTTEDDDVPGDKRSASVNSKASTAISSQAGGRLSILQIHRRKLDAMADAIRQDFDRLGFEMPDDPNNKFF